MAIDHTGALKTAFITALENDLGVQALVGDRIYDTVPQSGQKPYIRIGPMNSSPFEADCINGGDVDFAAHAFTKECDRDKASDIGAAIVIAAQVRLDLGSGIWADMIVTGWSVTEDTGEKGAWHARVDLNATTTG